jgi:hypothetical protein
MVQIMERVTVQITARKMVRVPAKIVRPSGIERLAALLALVAAAAAAWGEQPAPAAVAGFDAYVQKVETRLDTGHSSPSTYLAPVDWAHVRAGQPVIEDLAAKKAAELPGALLHDWRGTAFAPGATAADFERVLRNFAAYPGTFAPQVVSARAQVQDSGRARAVLRVRQKQVITVVLDTAYDITYARGDLAKNGADNSGPSNGPARGTIVSRSTRVDEIGADGRALSASAAHGYLWRMNTYWSYEERDGGLYMQLESVSLTRSIPTGLGWLVGPFVESVPRDSLEFTLRAVCAALKKPAG